MRIIVEVDARGRVSLAKLGIKSTQLIAEKTDNGDVILSPAVIMTRTEAAMLARAQEGTTDDMV